MNRLLLCIGLLIGMPFGLWAQTQPAMGGKQSLEEGLYATIYTEKGNIVLKLEYEKVPMTVANFVGLAEGDIQNSLKPLGTPFYDSVTFHRVIDNFMIQGGDPTGTGQGHPGYRFPDEFHPELKHAGPGILSMANSGPGTNGCQFFITHKATPWLDNKHSVFGHVVQGQEVVNAIAQGDLIDSIRIQRIGKEAQQFDGGDVFRQELAAFKEEQEQKKAMALSAYSQLVKERYPKAVKTASGLHYLIEEPGTGAPVEKGKTITVHYKGLLASGKQFDSSYDRGQPITFPVGVGKVIPGWDEGLTYFREGGKGVLIIPYTLGYGERGFPPAIPPLATLIFHIEVLKVQ